MSSDSQTSSLSRELTVLLPDAEYEQTLTRLKDYVASLEDVSVLTDAEFPTLPDELCEIISQISNDSKISYPWKYLYSIVIVKFREVLTTFDLDAHDYRDEQSSMLKRIDSILAHRFRHAPPFTIQRICDLLSEPKKYYKLRLKFTRAFEKVLTVISYSKVHCATPPPAYSASPDSKFSPPAKRIKYEISTASTVTLSNDSTSSSERNSIILPLTSFTEDPQPQEIAQCGKQSNKAPESSLPDPEPETECSVSEADSTTVTSARTSQDENEAEDATYQKIGVLSQQNNPDKDES